MFFLRALLVVNLPVANLHRPQHPRIVQVAKSVPLNYGLRSKKFYGQKCDEIKVFW
jgi:hypothetical protein